MIVFWVLLACSESKHPQNESHAFRESSSTESSPTDTARTDTAPIPPSTAVLCAEADAFTPMYADVLATWSAQDALGGWPAAPTVFVGSSSIRRWETLAESYRAYSPLQRGFGGAQLGEVAQQIQNLALRHQPRGIVVYAGTNDIDAGVAPDVVVGRFQCLRARVSDAFGVAYPLFYLAITPNPSRWDQWERAAQVNTAIAAMAEADPGLVFIDTATPFLETGSPPDAALFTEDGLHLSAAGYALWETIISPVLAATLTEDPPVQAATLPAGTRLRMDLGPNNAEDGEWTPSPDYLGQFWNNWHAVDGGMDILPGEQRVDLVDTTGQETGVDLVISGGFQANGRSNGGLLWPDPALLGDLAVGSATGDFFYTTGADVPGGIFLRGLNPNQRYTLRFFAAREDSERRVSRYTVDGHSVFLQTTGSGAGHAGGTVNDDETVVLEGLVPDVWGQLFIDIGIEEGTYGYLSILEVVVE